MHGPIDERGGNTPQVYMSTVGILLGAGLATGSRIDILRFTGNVATPSGTFDKYRTGTVIGLNSNWQLGGLAFDQ